MGCIIRVDSEKFITKFLKDFNCKDFQFIPISENITSNRTHKNIMPIPALMPPPNVTATFINEGYCKEYKNKYNNYLSKDEVNILLVTMIKAVLNDMQIVLICSKSEDEFKYLKLICDFIENEYRLKTFTLKEYSDNPSKANKVKNKDEIIKIVTKTISKLQDSDIKTVSAVIDKDKFVKKLKKLDKKELKALCKSKGIKISDEDKDEIIKKIKKKVFKN